MMMRMPRQRPLHQGYERLIGSAAIDAVLTRALLRDPQGTALNFGIPAEDASLSADIKAATLQSFATALLPRLYGSA